MKSAALGIFSLIAVLIFTFTLGFIWTGSAGVQYKRVAMTGDQSTAVILEEWRKNMQGEAEDVDTEVMDQGYGDMKMTGAGSGGGGDNTVIWINIPGFRGDYIEQAAAAFMQKMADEGAATTRMRPNFPPVTYAGHTTMATGTTTNIHGIPSDVFRVGGPGGTIVNRPMDSSLLEAEPIWETATRQEMPTLVHDWPLSQNQTGENKAAYFLTEFDPEATDEQRLDRLWEAWTSHQGDKKLRLLMCRLDDILMAGRINGPRADETYEAVKKTDALLQAFVEKTKAAWSNLRGTKDGNLAFLITTDHGLAELDKNINFKQLMGPEIMNNLEVAAHDAIAHLYFKNLPEGAAEANLRKDQIDSELKKRIYFRTYKQEDLPSDWKYSSAGGRVGDRVLVLKTGFAFSDVEAEEPVFNPSEGDGFYGGFGYPVSDSIRMSGQVILWGYPQQVSYGDMGEIDQTVFHSTVCKLLKIKTSEKASDKTLSLQ
ncbi:MAG: alkaline phosphatase family protein [Verrucomicrobiales bacterium]|nr:alkaline phosphatase family protein [Verrucomicrobiales bacterium]